jgi:hypothetical protein
MQLRDRSKQSSGGIMSLADDLMTGKQYFDSGKYDAALHWF